jgi:sporulation protein YabP
MSQNAMTEGQAHALTLSARERLSVSGVKEVESFDEQSVILQTDCGEMTVEGEALHVGTLDIARGVVEVQGRISAILYQEAPVKKRGWRARLLG